MAKGKHVQSLVQVADPHLNKRKVPQLMTEKDARLFTDLTEYSQGYVRRQLEKQWLYRHKKQWPFDALHREMRRAGLVHCQIGLDPPNWVDVWEYSTPPTTIKDKYGRVLYMDKGRRELKRLRPEEFAPVVRFEPLYPIHPDPVNATNEDKEKRIAAFLNAYAVSGMRTPSAEYVGVNYFQLILWINEREEWQAQLRVAEEAAKLIMVDIGKQRAMAGDSSLLRFFIERDNPEKYGKFGNRRSASDLPEGVTSESVASALAMIAQAQGAMSGETESKPLPSTTDDSDFPAALVNQTMPPETPSSSPPRVPLLVTIEADD